MAKYKLKKIRSISHGYPSGDDIRLAPEERLCAKFDPDSIATFPVSAQKPIADRIVDNCAEEHIM